jgi:hypothetical protein
MKRPSRHYVAPIIGEVVGGRFEPRPELVMDPVKFFRDYIQDSLRYAAVFDAYRERERMKKKSNITRILQ